MHLTYLRDLAEFALIMFLGFMPLIVIHLAHRLPKATHSRLRYYRQRAVKLALVAKTSLLLLLADWSLMIAL